MDSWVWSALTDATTMESVSGPWPFATRAGVESFPANNTVIRRFVSDALSGTGVGVGAGVGVKIGVGRAVGRGVGVGSGVGVGLSAAANREQPTTPRARARTSRELRTERR